MKTGIELIAEERQEQIEKHGWSLDHDASYSKGQLVQAANYCLVLAGFIKGCALWPDGWDSYFMYKIRNKSILGKMVVAGALLMAENDRRGDSMYKELIDKIAKYIDDMPDYDSTANRWPL